MSDLLMLTGRPEYSDDDEACGSPACVNGECTFNDHDTFDLYDETQATDEEPWGPSIGTRGGEGALACAMHDCNNFVRTSIPRDELLEDETE
jgi:hypothetical protein